MKHIGILLKVVVMTLVVVMDASYAFAQQNYRIKSIYRTYRGKPDLNFYLYYQEDGRILKAETEHLDYTCHESIDFVYDDINETISMAANRIEKWGNWSAKPKVSLKNGKIRSYDSYGEDQSKPQKYEISYDIQERVNKIVCNDYEYEEMSVFSPEWNDGNLTKLVKTTTYTYDNSEDTDISEYEYTDYPNPESNILFSPFFEDFDAFYIPVPHNYLSSLMGARTKNLPKRLTKSPKDEGDEPRHEDYFYVFDEYGNISEIIIVDKKGEYLHFWITYETFTNTSVAGVNDNSRKPVACYNSMGQKIEKPGKGMNIIRYNDDSVKKIIIK